MWSPADPARIDLTHEIRTISFENPTGAKGAAGSTFGGRKGAPNKMLAPGEHLVLAEITGPGRVRHVWMTFPPMPPEAMRSLWMEVYYDDAREPSVSAPCLDFFGLPHGRPAPYASALAAAQEGRGFNSWLPMPFWRRIRIELTNGSKRIFPFYYQVAYTLGQEPIENGLLHASFRRENPTTLRRDFVIADGLRGPGRFIGCNVGIRILPEPDFTWYGEGEVKMYLDNDDALPTWCGTGLEDYVGTAWGMGAHTTDLQGVPLVLQAPGQLGMPDFVELLPLARARPDRVPQPLPRDDPADRRGGRAAGARRHPRAPRPRGPRGRLGLVRAAASGPLESFAVCERQDDYCATSFVYCRDAQPVPRLDLAAATADIARRPYETPSPYEAALSLLTP